MRRDHQLDRHSCDGVSRQKVRQVLRHCTDTGQAELANDLAGVKYPCDDRDAIRTIANGLRTQAISL
ncbi:hypothetical protein KA517_03430 [Candidatus Gracilibacteria bacterium]|nr:hypothetical protein [Candidatus Gracilibacteria bacterium]